MNPSTWISDPVPGGSLRGRGPAAALWLFYVVIVLEILFMISPAALYFYSAYGPGLGVLHRSPWTAWLTQFFLPHFSQTRGAVLALQKPLATVLVLTGLLGFVIGFVQVYVSKLRRAGAVSGGLYRFVRHPQYTSLAVLGLGTLLLWPRFLVLVMYATMLCLYSWLARREEALCLERFGAEYARYLRATGRFLPRFPWSRREPSDAPSAVDTTGVVTTASRGIGSRVAGLARGALVVALAVAAGFVLRDYSLLHVSGVYDDEVAILSPATMTAVELRSAFELAATDAATRERLPEGGALLVYVLPESWHLADLPAERFEAGSGGHETPGDWDRTRLKVLFTAPRSHAEAPRGFDIVRTAYGREPLSLVHLDLGAGAVVGVDTPPAHVLWGDIPTPMF